MPLPKASVNDDTPAGEVALVKAASDESLERILREAFVSLRPRRPSRLARGSAAVLPALVLTLAALYLMGRLLAVPAVESELPIPLIIEVVAPPASRVMPDSGKAARLPLLHLPLTEIAPSKLVPYPRITSEVGPPVIATAVPASRRVDWAQALRDYLLKHSQGGKRRPFAMPELPAQPPSVFSLPERMRLSTGGEIDQIGNHCYAVPSDITFNAEATGDPQYARYLYSIRSLFAHEVPCDTTPGKTWVEDLQSHLERHGYPPPKP